MSGYWDALRDMLAGIRTYQATMARAVASEALRCAYCARDADSIDHVWPRSDDGPDEVWNTVPVCRRCNSSKGNKSLGDWVRWLADHRDPRTHQARHVLVEHERALGKLRAMGPDWREYSSLYGRPPERCWECGSREHEMMRHPCDVCGRDDHLTVNHAYLASLGEGIRDVYPYTPPVYP